MKSKSKDLKHWQESDYIAGGIYIPLLPGPTTPHQTLLAIGRAEDWFYRRRAAGLPVDPKEAERAFKIRMRLECLNQ